MRGHQAELLGLALLLAVGCSSGVPSASGGSVAVAEVVHATPLPTPTAPRDPIQVKCGQLADSPLDPHKAGDGVPLSRMNARQAEVTCQSAAALPDYRAQYLFDYGRALFAGGSVTEAVKQFSAAADAGNGLAAYTLAGLYESGYGVKPDLDQASHWYELAGSNGYADGFAAVGALYLLRANPDYAEAVKWFEAARRDGSTMGAALLGWAYETGSGVSKDPAKAAAAYTEAATPPINGFAAVSPWVLDAMYRLGQLEFGGNGVSKDPAGAVKWFEKAAGQDYSLAKTAMGYSYLTGSGYPQKDSDALLLFRQAAQQDEPYAEYDLGLMYLFGRSVQADPQEARKLFQEAADNAVSEVAEKARARLTATAPLPRSTSPDNGQSEFLAPAAQPAMSAALALIRYRAEHPEPTPPPAAGLDRSLTCPPPTWSVVNIKSPAATDPSIADTYEYGWTSQPCHW